MSNFSYDYVEAKVGLSPAIYGLAFSQSIHPNAHLRAEVETEFESDFNGTIERENPINDWADAYGEIGFRAVEQPGIFSGDAKYQNI